MRNDLLIHDMDQRSEEWFGVRAGKVTGSTAAPLLVNGKNELSIGTGMWGMIVGAAGKLITEEPDPPQFTKYETRRGQDLEPVALKRYEEEEWVSAELVGFCEWVGRLAGCSPDFLVPDQNKGGEIKCLMSKGHFGVALAHHEGQDENEAYYTGKGLRLDDISPDHYKQIQWSMFVCDLDLWDIVHFHPGGQKAELLIQTIERDDDMIEIYDEKLRIYEEEVKRIIKIFAWDPDSILMGL